MVELARTKLRIGAPINAPGAPTGYRYGDTVFCPSCDHKSLIYRPRKRLWVCNYSSTIGARCSYVASTYVQRATMIRNNIAEGQRFVGDKLSSDICGDLVIDVLGEDLALTHIDEVCGNGARSNSRNAKSPNLSYSSAKMKKYRQKYIGG